MREAQYDIVVFGATSFVGKLLCGYLADQFGGGDPLRWAAAGRSLDKLQHLRASLGAGQAALPLIVADAADESALEAMCSQTRVVISTVGPYALYGEPLVKVCTATGTDYCDLTGEVHWIKRMLDRYEPAAKASGARIVHCCGFDSIPSDLGVFFLQEEARRRFGEHCTKITMRVKAMRGGASGGTIASIMNIAKEAAGNPALRKDLANPYLLCPKADAPHVRQPGVGTAGYDPDYGAWVAPFVMAGINTRIVHRSNALSGYSYGRDFRYDEAMLTGKGLAGRAKALAVTAGLGGFLAASALSPTRWALKRVLPAPGEGPSSEAQASGFYDLRFIGTTSGGQVLRAKVVGAGDPGYGSTSKILGQAGACLAFDVPGTEKAGGFWTPATIFGNRLIQRLPVPCRPAVRTRRIERPPPFTPCATPAKPRSVPPSRRRRALRMPQAPAAPPHARPFVPVRLASLRGMPVRPHASRRPDAAARLLGAIPASACRDLPC